MGVPLHKRKSIVHNVFDSHELPGTEGKPNWNPLLISRRAQGKLGLVKDCRAGTIYLKDYPEEEVEVCKTEQDLLCIRLDQFCKASKSRLADLLVTHVGSEDEAEAHDGQRKPQRGECRTTSL